MTDDPAQPTPPRLLFGTQLVLPPGFRDVTLEQSGTMFAIVGAEAFRQRPPAPVSPPPSPARPPASGTPTE
jgi:hypothetical protein